MWYRNNCQTLTQRGRVGKEADMENPNGSVAKGSVTRLLRVTTGKKGWTLGANLSAASRKIKLGGVALLPYGQEWLRVRGGWLRVS